MHLIIPNICLYCKNTESISLLCPHPPFSYCSGFWASPGGLDVAASCGVQPAARHAPPHPEQGPMAHAASEMTLPGWNEHFFPPLQLSLQGRQYVTMAHVPSVSKTGVNEHLPQGSGKTSSKTHTRPARSTGATCL